MGQENTMPRYDLPAAADGSEQWIQLKDPDEITRKEIRAYRSSWNGDAITFRDQKIEGAIAQGLVNWQVKTTSGADCRRPAKDQADVIKVTADIPSVTWFAIEEVVFGPPMDANDLGYIGLAFEPQKPSSTDEQDPADPS